MVYEFRESHERGKEAEVFVYEYFQRFFNVIPASPDLQDQGIDFVFEDRRSRQLWRVELKTDWTAARTGNAFVETISVLRQGKVVRLGWAYLSRADWLLYFLPSRMPPTIYRLSLEVLRVELPAWEKLYPTRAIPNRDARRGSFDTVGLLVPIQELVNIAQEVIEL